MIAFHSFQFKKTCYPFKATVVIYENSSAEFALLYHLNFDLLRSEFDFSVQASKVQLGKEKIPWKTMAFSNLQAMFKLAQRPTHTISDREGEEFDLKSDAKDALLIIKNCTDCHASLQEKAAKLLVQSCKNFVLDMKSTLISGTLEFLSCKKVVVNLLEGGQVRK